MSGPPCFFLTNTYNAVVHFNELQPQEKRGKKAIAKYPSKALVKAHPPLSFLTDILLAKSNVPSLEMLEQTSRFQLHRSLLKR